eukprot:m.139907 g.139907  ORF g.139907 m.139907 type:complete len:92 (+) comp14815_c0_seq5:883-1158(+)
MLNADMELAYHAVQCTPPASTDPIDRPQRQGSCDRNNDIANGPYTHTERYAGDNNAWLRDFEESMEVMTELGTTGGLFKTNANNYAYNFSH